MKNLRHLSVLATILCLFALVAVFVLDHAEKQWIEDWQRSVEQDRQRDLTLRKAHAEMVRQLDTDGDGRLAPHEYPTDEVALQRFDANGDGIVTEEEYRLGDHPYYATTDP